MAALEWTLWGLAMAALYLIMILLLARFCRMAQIDDEGTEKNRREHPDA